MSEETREERMARAFPHGPDEPCTCDGYTSHRETWGTPQGRCVCWPGRELGCTCDIEWDWDS